MHKTILITGATDGIGRLTAQKLANDGHQVLLHGRNKAKLEEVAEQIGGVQTFLADFSDMDEVAAMATLILAKHDRLDVLINNAGIFNTANAQTRAGRDIRFDVNAFAPYLLTRRLLPIMPGDGLLEFSLVRRRLSTWDLKLQPMIIGSVMAASLASAASVEVCRRHCWPDDWQLHPSKGCSDL